MRFKLDENLPSSLVAEFSAADHDAMSVVEQDLSGGTDSSVVEVCRAENRALVTTDKGFADIRAYPPSENRGIMVLRLKRHDIPTIVATLRRAIKLLDDHPLDRRLWIVEGDKVRFRQ